MCTQLANRTINVCTNIEKIQLKLQLQQTIALRISSSILAFTGKTIFNFLSFKTSTEL